MKGRRFTIPAGIITLFATERIVSGYQSAYLNNRPRITTGINQRNNVSMRFKSEGRNLALLLRSSDYETNEKKTSNHDDILETKNVSITPNQSESSHMLSSMKQISNAMLTTAVATLLMIGCGTGVTVGETLSWQFVPPASAAVAPLADVGLREFLVKDGKQFLRLSLPTSLPMSEDPEILGDDGRTAQQAVELVRLRLEQVGFSGKTPIWNACLKDVNKAKSIVMSPKILKGIPSENMKRASEVVDAATKKLDELAVAVRNQDIKSTQRLQEEAGQLIFEIRDLSLEPRKLPYSVPSEYSKLPQLRGRATVECTLSKKSGSYILQDGTRSKDAKLVLIIDGYHAPITAGNFIDLVNTKFYDNKAIQISDDLLVQLGKGQSKREKIPLELFYKKDSAPIYEYTSDDDMRATESFSIPFQAYGALGMEHDEEDVNTATTEFWFLKWDQALVAPARNTLDGSHACFGYVVENQDLLSQVGVGDTIVEMKVVKGGENLFSSG